MSTHARPASSPMSHQAPAAKRARGGGHRGGRGGRGGGGGVSTGPAPTPAAQSPVDDVLAPTATKHLSDKCFKDFPIRAELLRGIDFDRCTEVQAKTLAPILAGGDVLAQAKTGTGKTLAFLIPTLQALISLPETPPASKTSILILSPTRELALQIATACEPFLRFLPVQLGIQTAIGGTSLDKDLKQMRNGRVDILIATPGRLLDHIENHGLGPRLSGVKWVVLDEADRLLEQGFRKEIVKILSSLPKREVSPRQTLLFSATVPPDVHAVANLALLPNHAFISTLSEADQNTHAHVAQEYLLVAPADALPAGLRLIEAEQAANPSAKIMVFLPTARATGLTYEVFSRLNIGPVWEIHSRKSQSQRTKATDEFKLAKNGILVSSDVVARGIDVPGVSSVLQIGLPSSAEQYVHRLGRTARAGASGFGNLVLTHDEAFFVRKRDVQALGLKQSKALNSNYENERQRVEQVLEGVSAETKAQAYQAWLGFYNSSLRDLGWSQDQLVAKANQYALEGLRFVGDSPGATPPLLAKTVGKMGLRGVKGLNIVKELPGGAASGGGARGGRGAPRGSSRPSGSRGGRGGGHENGPAPVPGSGGRLGAESGGNGRGGARGARGGRGGRGRGGATA